MATPSDLVIREVTPGIWTFSRPFQRAPFMPFGGRSTAITLQDGSVWLLASTKVDDETLTKLREIGPVKYIIAPDLGHWLNLQKFTEAFPDAKVIGVAGLETKVPGVKFAGLYGKDPADTLYGYEPEIIGHYFSDFQNRDVAFFHAPSRTLIEADLLFNLPPTEQYSKSKESGKTWLPIISNLSPWKGQHRLFLKPISKGPAMKDDAKLVAGWDFDRVIPCHGDVIETKGNDAWRSAYANFLK
ncbi:hypothetical protein FRB96_006864 [Tulasnella sp. 330]|nr:hypothetical protein FRB96_006864 [Tulasnella sp. 330]KAG8873682.1 hypothetical protein FRB97_006538 [Tulasnella sp. 331]